MMPNSHVPLIIITILISHLFSEIIRRCINCSTINFAIITTLKVHHKFIMSAKRPLDIITAINLTRKYEHKDASHLLMEETTTLRFKVGDRVACNVGETFQTGTVIKLWYTEKYYPEGANRLQSLVPYQVRLDNDNTIYAPKDEDGYIKISNSPHICGNCAKEESSDNNLKSCTSCKMVKYCNRQCQKAHRKKHMERCTKQAARLHDEKLFKLPPPLEDCPICMERLPSISSGKKYQYCCGKIICIGCTFAHAKEDPKEKCPFCRIPPISPYSVGVDRQVIERLKERIKLGDATACHQLGLVYMNGLHGLPRDYDKGFELCLRAGKMGCADAYQTVGNIYANQPSLLRDEKKGQYYVELAAIAGHSLARYQLSHMEVSAGNSDVALKHLLIAVESAGYADALNDIKTFFRDGRATKEDYTKALQDYQAYLAQIKTTQRDEAAAFRDIYKYY